MPNYNSEDETDNESYGSWDDTDVESEIDDPIYEPEEPSLTKYNIVLCEKYNRQNHGNVDGEINNHYLTLIRFTTLDNNYIMMLRRNYPFGKIEIAECLYLSSDHCVSILKTHWLRLIQRTWKKICTNRKLTILRRSHPNSLKYREIYGKWPNNCNSFPTLKGMLSNLS